MKKILVLGASGQDGSFISKFLLKKNFKVFGLIRKSATGNLKNLVEIINHPNFKICHGDLLDIFSLEKVISDIKPNEVYNFADQDHVKWSFEIPIYSLNVTGFSVVNILEIIRKYSPKTKFFQPLSSNMFGDSKKTKQDEKEVFSPLSIYALGKVTAFYACEMYKKLYNLKVYSAIFYNHESEIRPDEYVTRKITKSVARIFYGKQKKIILGDIDSKIDWGYAKDYVEAAYTIVQQKKPDYFVIASGKSYSVKYFLEKCFDYVNLDYRRYTKINKNLFRPKKNATLIGNTKKAFKTFKFKNKTNLDQLISIMMEKDLELEK